MVEASGCNVSGRSHDDEIAGVPKDATRCRAGARPRENNPAVRVVQLAKALRGG